MGIGGERRGDRELPEGRSEMAFPAAGEPSDEGMLVFRIAHQATQRERLD